VAEAQPIHVIALPLWARAMGRAFNGLALASLLLCIALCGTWAYSAWRDDPPPARLTWAERIEPRPPGLAPRLSKEKFHLSHFAEPEPASTGRMPGASAATRVDSAWLSVTESVQVYGRGRAVPPAAAPAPAVLPWRLQRTTLVLVPLPRWAAAAAVLPALWLLVFAGCRWRERRQAEAGLCLNCGYDLRATPDRCPECGAVPDPVGRAVA
jgi:hypothetical protein